MTQLLVIRHGQSEWNADGRWQGQADPPLTELGREQARRAARALGAIDALFASPLGRAATTAAILSEELGVGPVVTMPGLMERHAGEWQGLTRIEIEESFPGHLDAGRRPSGWEPDAEVETRVMSAFDAIHRDHPYGTVVAIAHAGVIFAAESAFDVGWERLANLGGRWFAHSDGGWSIGERVHLLTDETIPDQL
ncbi:MAG: histidine phosphatase family protein [Actinobacteria bacterium]|nr:histidine phosphatase family protein [Actinomycetota bacterium]